MPSEEEIAAQKAAADAKSKEEADAKVKADADAKAKADADAAAAAEAAKKIEEEKAGDVNKGGKMVPEWQLLEAKAALEEKYGKKVADLEAIIAKSTTKEEVAENLDDIYKSYPDVDKNFINIILAKAKDAAMAEIKPLTEKVKADEQASGIEAKFQKAYKIAMEKLGKDFDGIVNIDVIRKLTQLPENAGKVFSEIIEETYGAALTGKRTIEATRPGGGKDPVPLDFEKARRDSKYFDEVMSDPKLKEAYNAKMLAEGL